MKPSLSDARSVLKKKHFRWMAGMRVRCRPGGAWRVLLVDRGRPYLVAETDTHTDDYFSDLFLHEKDDPYLDLNDAATIGCLHQCCADAGVAPSDWTKALHVPTLLRALDGEHV